MIGGVLHFRITPNGEWRELTKRELCEKIKNLENGYPPDFEFVEWACLHYKLTGRNRWIHKRDDLGVEEAYMTSEKLYKHYLSLFRFD